MKNKNKLVWTVGDIIEKWNGYFPITSAHKSNLCNKYTKTKFIPVEKVIEMIDDLCEQYIMKPEYMKPLRELEKDLKKEIGDLQIDNKVNSKK
jgi:hypothetical protein